MKKHFLQTNKKIFFFQDILYLKYRDYIMLIIFRYKYSINISILCAVWEDKYNFSSWSLRFLATRLHRTVPILELFMLTLLRTVAP